MAFIICDDHNLSVEADGIDPATARKLMLERSDTQSERDRTRGASSSANTIATAISACWRIKPRA